MKVRNIQGVLMAIIIVAPSAVLPETLYDIGLVLVVRRVAVLRGQLARHLTIHDVATTLHHHTSALEVFRAAVMLLILALRVCAHLDNCH